MNASGRPNTCKSNGVFGHSGARVSNAYAICPWEGDSPGKPGVIPHNVSELPNSDTKVEAPRDKRASD